LTSSPLRHSVAANRKVERVNVSRLALSVSLGAVLAGCQHREPVQVTRDRATERFLLMQIEDLEKLVAKAEKGELVTTDKFAIGIAESAARELLNASLPREQMLGNRVRLRLETATPFFRGNNAALVFQARAQGKLTGATARVELGGRLGNFRIENGTLLAGIELGHFKVLDSSLGDVAMDVLEGLVRDNLDALSHLLPPLEIPVHLEQAIKVDGLTEGVVVARPGVLPLAVTLAEVIPVNERLWVLIDVKAGPWERSVVAVAEKGT
jgi:hypothetical protein